MKLMTRSLTVLTLLAVAACGGEDGTSGPAGANGPAGENGANGEPGKSAEPSNDPASVSLVTPSKGVRDREVEVQIGGSKTKFADGAKPDFGPGIEVVEVKAASPTLLLAKLKIAPTAKLGPRSVKVGDVEAKDAFNVIPAVKFGATGTTKVDQGGGAIVALENNDSIAFDAKTFALVSDQFLDLATSASGGQSGTLVLLAPPLAAVGKGGLTFANLDAEGKPRITFGTVDDAVEVVARTPSALTFGTAKPSEALGANLATKLYKFSTTANETAAVELTLHVEDSTALWTAVWDAGGKRKDLVATLDASQREAPYDVTYLLPVESGAAKDLFLTTLNVAAKEGTFSLTPVKSLATIINEAADSHSEPAEAQEFTLAAPGAANIIKGEVTDDSFDWYKIVVAANETVVVSVDSTSSLIAAVVNSAGTRTISPWSTSAAKEGVRTAKLTAGSYYVVVAGETETDVGNYTATVKRIATPN